jgi:ribosome maturation factor RimP
MTKHEDYEQRTQKLLEPILEKNHYELYDVEFVKEGGNWYLRIFIDKDSGITIDDCELVSKALSELLDVHDYISEAYMLEVSSPGLGRQLRRDRHFEKSIGEEVEVKLFKPINKKKEYIGLLKSFDQNTITIELEDQSSMEIPRNQISTVRLTFDF